jgi:hypothetical protein
VIGVRRRDFAFAEELILEDRIDKSAHANDDGDSDCAGEQPISDGREVLPEGQIPSVVDIEGGQQQDVGCAHATDVNPRPPRPVTSASGAPDHGRAEGKRSEDEQVIVLSPTHHARAVGTRVRDLGRGRNAIPTLARKSGDVEGTTIPAMIVVSLGIQTPL